ncbi:MAG: hypothetical protein Q9185_000497 [Variospora sp. 1 TL-2023]
MEYTTLYTSHHSHDHNDLDTFLCVTRSTQMSRKSRLGDQTFGEGRTGFKLRAAPHLPCLRRSHNGTIDTYDEHESRPTYSRHKDRIPPGYQRFDYALLRSPADQSQALMIPFLARTTIQINAIAASQMAEVALNVLGIIHLLLHVFLRANAELTAIQKMEATWTKRQRLRLFGSSDLEMTMHITSPMLLEKGEARRFDDDNYKLTQDLRRFSRIPQSSSPPTIPVDGRITYQVDYTSDAKFDHPEPAPSPPQVYLSPCTSRKASNYSIFPTFRSAMLRNSTSTTFSQGSDDALEPLKPILPVCHKREFSEQTSATVHIGCRLSNLNDAHHSSHSSSSTHNSFPLPLYGTDRAGIESSLIGPMSSRPKAPSGLSQDIVFLPIQNYRISQEKAVRSSRPEYLVRTWFTPRKSRSRSEYGRMTMKALPPDPPVENKPVQDPRAISPDNKRLCYQKFTLPTLAIIIQRRSPFKWRSRLQNAPVAPTAQPCGTVPPSLQTRETSPKIHRGVKRGEETGAERGETIETAAPGATSRGDRQGRTQETGYQTGTERGGENAADQGIRVRAIM